MRFDRPIGIFLLLWPTLWGLWIAAKGAPEISLVCIFVVGTVLMRAAGCVINDYFDKPFDGLVERTKDRVLVRSQIPAWHALIVFIVLIVLASGLLFFLNRLAIQLACISVLMTIIYPLLKRFTNLPQLFLGLAFSMGIPMAYASVTNSLPGVGWVLYSLSVIHTLAFDTIYGMVDKKSDEKIGLYSTAIYWGDSSRQYILVLQFVFILVWFALGFYLGFRVWFYYALLITSLLFLYQYRLNKREATMFRAFLNNNWVGLVIFLGIIVSQN